MASTPANRAPPSTTTSTGPLCASSERRQAYEAGFKQGEAELELVRKEMQRWREEAQWWKDEHDRLHKEFCEFVANVAGGGLKK